MFTIGMVNYKTSNLIETQLKIYAQFAGTSFKIILFDTSGDDKEYQRLIKLSQMFSISMQVVQYNPEDKSGSGAHGESLQCIYNMVDTEYFLTQDPDFFWVKPNFLVYLRGLLCLHDAVGAPYRRNNVNQFRAFGIARPDFPAAFGAVYRVSVLQAIGANFKSGHSGMAKEYKVTKDVGYQIRDNFGDRPYFSFEQKEGPLGAGPIFSANLVCTYLDQNNVVAHHLHRSSVIMSPYYPISKHPDRLEWIDNRKRLCAMFWDEINERKSEI